MEKELVKNNNVTSIIAILMLLFAIPSGIWPYGYYIILRWVVAGAAIFVSLSARELKREVWFW